MFRDTLQCAHWIIMAWTSHHNEDDEMIFLHLNTVQFSSFSTKWMILPWSPSASHLCIWLSSSAPAHVQCLNCNWFSFLLLPNQSITHQSINQSNQQINLTSFSISRYFRLFSSFSFGIPSFSFSFCFSTTCQMREIQN